MRTPLASLFIWRPGSHYCGSSQSNTRKRLIYYFFPNLPDMSLALDNFSVRLDIDGFKEATSFPLALQIGYRSCW